MHSEAEEGPRIVYVSQPPASYPHARGAGTLVSVRTLRLHIHTGKHKVAQRWLKKKKKITHGKETFLFFACSNDTGDTGTIYSDLHIFPGAFRRSRGPSRPGRRSRARQIGACPRGFAESRRREEGGRRRVSGGSAARCPGGREEGQGSLSARTKRPQRGGFRGDCGLSPTQSRWRE